MTSDDWLSNGLPVFNGGKDRSNARKLIDKLGGSGGFKTIQQTAADGTVTTVQLKGTAPPQVTIISPLANTVSQAETHLFRYSYAPNVSFAPLLNAAQVPVKDSLLVPYKSHDGIIDIWWQAKKGSPFSLATKVRYASGTCSLWEPSGGNDYLLFPATLVGTDVYVGNTIHGLLGKVGGQVTMAYSTNNGVIEASASGFEVVSPDTTLTLFSASTTSLVVPGGVLTPYAILGTYDRVYDFVTGIKLGKNRSLYTAPDGTRFAITTVTDSVIAAYNQDADIQVAVYATPTQPKELADPTPSPRYVGSFTCRSPGVSPGDGTAGDTSRAALFTYPSPSGGKLGVNVVRIKRESDDFRWTEYLSAVYEITLSGGGANSVPAATLIFHDSSANDVAITEYEDTPVREPSYPKFISQTDVIDSEEWIGVYQNIRLRHLTRTSVYSTNGNQKATIHGVSLTKRSQLAIAGYNYAGGETIQVVRVNVEAHYHRTGFDEDDSVVSTRQYTEEAYETGFTYKTTPGAVTSITGNLRFMDGGFRSNDPWTYPHDTTASVTASVLVNGSAQYVETSNARSDSGKINYTANPAFGPFNIEAYMVTSSATTAQSSSGDTANALPVIFAEHWRNQAIGYSSNNTAVWELITGANSRGVLLTLDGYSTGLFGTTDAEGLFWVSYNPYTKETSCIRDRVWI